MAGKLTKSGDVYAFGVVVWGLCLGKLPWHGLRAMQIIMQVLLCWLLADSKGGSAS